ncbi:hypothetical protein [Campylobacter canadensis]|uniref:PilN domain-containing protein n=1 Tax=Campylobacter canadensis TaxID=449520 RepID=A0ABS7WUY5_9BACT|nr:hypothetical protein [Campylobacter canadensis]MBZ7987729.1 hypothetical protein [Campylobacter canadensis]MBZ7994136.1 hypothetical protein [Campylobacter canadensis]MBZ7995861.1 hypothetical protein [Campylobacter canadensis]MBZ7997498.1 hypothetical protein [Campylobacter canadensis]MBZ7999467.1 hypothetical protein [Campylobacter canadensis]
MIYSLKTPNLKPILNKFNKLCLIVFLSFVAFISFFNIYLFYKNIYYKNLESDYNQQSIQIQEKITQLREDINLKNKQLFLIKDSIANNEIMQQNIKNLFDLVPDNITLSEVRMDKNEVVIKGDTPTKELFNTLFYAPLKSIFNASTTNFVQKPNGWYNFVSVNLSDENLNE